jgi:hypothetical protein
MEFDQMKQQRQPVATDAKRATLLGKLLGRRSETVSNSTPFDVHPDTKPRAAASFAAGKSAPLATPLHTGAPTQNDTPMTAVPQHPIESISRQDIKSVVVEGPVEPDPSEYCTPRPESPHTTNVPTFEVDDSRSVVKKTSFIRASPGRSPAKSNNVNKNSPGRILKNRLYATAEDSRIFVAAHRPRSISSEGLFMGYIHPSSSSSSSSNSSSSSSNSSSSSSNSNSSNNSSSNTDISGIAVAIGCTTNVASVGANVVARAVNRPSSTAFISPRRHDFLFRRPNAVRTPGGHLLTTVTPQPASVRMRGASNVAGAVGYKRRRRQQSSQPSNSKIDFTKRMGEQDRKNKFVRVITPLRKRLKRTHTSSQDMTESQQDRKNESNFDRGLLDSPSDGMMK